MIKPIASAIALLLFAAPAFAGSAIPGYEEYPQDVPPLLPGDGKPEIPVVTWKDNRERPTFHEAMRDYIQELRDSKASAAAEGLERYTYVARVLIGNELVTLQGNLLAETRTEATKLAYLRANANGYVVTIDVSSAVELLPAPIPPHDLLASYTKPKPQHVQVNGPHGSRPGGKTSLHPPHIRDFLGLGVGSDRVNREALEPDWEVPLPYTRKDRCEGVSIRGGGFDICIGVRSKETCHGVSIQGDGWGVCIGVRTKGVGDLGGYYRIPEFVQHLIGQRKMNGHRILLPPIKCPGCHSDFEFVIDDILDRLRERKGQTQPVVTQQQLEANYQTKDSCVGVDISVGGVDVCIGVSQD